MNNFKFVAWFRHALIAVLLLFAGFFLDAAEPATAPSIDRRYRKSPENTGKPET